MAYDVTALDSVLEHDTSNGTYNAICKYDTDRICLMWKGASNGLIRCFSVDPVSGALAGLGTAAILEAAAGISGGTEVIKIDSTHVLALWNSDQNNKINGRIYSIDGSGNLTALGAAMTELAAPATGTPVRAVLVDATHVLVVYYTGGTTTFTAKIFTVNTSTGAIAGVGTAYETTTWIRPATLEMLDSTHALCMGGSSPDDAALKVLTINTSTWAVTLAAATTVVSGITIDAFGGVVVDEDASPIICAGIYINSSGGTTGTVLITFSINTSTWAATLIDTEQLDTATTTPNDRIYKGMAKIDDTHIVMFYKGTDGDGFAKSYEVDASGNLTLLSTLEFDTDLNQDNAVVEIATNKFVNAWAGTAADGMIRAFETVIAVSVTVTQGTPPNATFSIPAPTITAIRNVTISQGTPPAATFSIPAYTVQISVSITPSAQAATFSIPTYDVIIADVSVSVSAQVLTFSIPAYAVDAERHVVVSPDALALTLSIPSYTPQISVSVEVGALTATFSIGSPSASGGSNVAPAAQAMTFSIPSYAITATRTAVVSPSALAMTFSAPAPSISTTRFITIEASPVGLSLTIPVFTIIADFWQNTYDYEPDTNWSDQHSPPSTTWNDKY